MPENIKTILINSRLFISISVVGLTLLAGCGGGAESDNQSSAQTQNNVALSMDIPDSVTGGKSATIQSAVRAASSASQGAPCAYLGVEDDEPFRNGYQMTKFMVSAVATWTCVADVLIDISDWVPQDGAIYETENDSAAANYDREEPTHYSVTNDSETQTTIRIYYGYDRITPPGVGEDPQFYISWNEAVNGDIDGRLIINGLGVNPDNREPEDPTMLRMDFSQTSTDETADMFLRFDNGNQWAEGFRILVNKDLSANPLTKVFVARGMIEMKAQFLPVNGITEIPTVQMYTVADSFGSGAAIAEFQDVTLPLELNTTSNNHLGNYLFTQNDVYFFQEDGDWDWVNKTITTAEYRGGRTTPATGGTWIPFDPSLDVIVLGLALDPDYFTGAQCANLNDDCTDLLNAVFIDGFAGQEPNQGADPMDWRSTAVANPDYLTTVYPNGVDWTGAFDLVFLPPM
ncbi:hypothetical protein MNBD_GAMMA21-2748 [hydrothermal vent metagenome]|uniref:Uncharacterized protein n=1 Tax=hydrothermal vent metagenome TaxID=652676 RepID=A0A3B1A5M9_9ZZZZ